MKRISVERKTSNGVFTILNNSVDNTLISRSVKNSYFGSVVVTTDGWHNDVVSVFRQPAAKLFRRGNPHGC